MTVTLAYALAHHTNICPLLAKFERVTNSNLCNPEREPPGQDGRHQSAKSIFYRKKAKALKEKARKDYEKYSKQYQKRQSKAELMAEKELKKLAKEWDQGYNEDISTMPHRPSNVLLALKQKMTRSTSQGESHTRSKMFI